MIISTIHGVLPLVLSPAKEVPVTEHGRMDICRVRGEAFGQPVNVQITLNTHTGELMLFSPDYMVGAFRIGDLISAHIQNRMVTGLRAAQEDAANA
ncbi:MAG: hypothetical protein HYX47_10355 [Burkholderiales bacterium]|nr:hypothetical protein [Burkholderiales bacterium]